MELTLVLIADLSDESVAGFREYEDRVLPLLTRHAGRLERRLRTADGLTEVHIVTFASRASYEGYAADPERQAQRGLLDGGQMQQRLLEVTDV
jgi:hypothetical protein